jgi:hypothetical protein
VTITIGQPVTLNGRYGEARLANIFNLAQVFSASQKTGNMNVCRTLSLNILLPQRGIQVVVVHPSDPISILCDNVRLSNCDFVFGGQLLSAAHSFEFYHMCNRDSLVAVRSESSLVRWLKVTEQSDDFTALMQCAVNPKARIEFLKLQDLRRMRMESRPRTMRRLKQTLSSRGLEGIRTETVVPDRPTDVSRDPLPELWEKG